jgi:hypothetical protein
LTFYYELISDASVDGSSKSFADLAFNSRYVRTAALISWRQQLESRQGSQDPGQAKMEVQILLYEYMCLDAA